MLMSKRILLRSVIQSYQMMIQYSVRANFVLFVKRNGYGTAAPYFLSHVYCGQTARCIKLPFGTEVGLGPGHIVLDGNPVPP